MALITTIAEFKKYIAIDANTKMVSLTPYVKEAEKFYIIDLLGKEFYDEFTETYEASIAETPTPLSDVETELLAHLQTALAYYTLLQAMPHLAVTFGELGVRQHRGDDSDAAPRWLQEKLQFQALRNGDLHADKMLEFLETNATSENDFNTWFASSSNTKNSGFIIYNTSVASRHIDINGSRRVFLKLRNKLREVERRIVPKLIGMEQYEELVTQLQTGGLSNPTAANKELIAKLEPIICKRALYLQLPFLRVQINENGIFIYSGTDDLVLLGQLATDADIKILRAQLMDGELGYLSDEQELRQFILDNIDDYPLIKATGVYTSRPDPGPMWDTLNDPNNKFFSV